MMTFHSSLNSLTAVATELCGNEVSFCPALSQSLVTRLGIELHLSSIGFSEEKRGEWLSWINGSEMERYRALRHEDDQRRFLLGRTMVRRVAAAKMGLEPGDVRVNVDSNGRPYVDGFHSFNVSHSGDLVVLAVSKAGAIGVDIEVASTPHPHEVVRSVFHSYEFATYNGLAGCEQTDYFYSIWTRKEAVLKALGVGFELNPAAVNVQSSHARIFCSSLFRLSQTQIWSGKLSQRYHLALAVCADLVTDLHDPELDFGSIVGSEGN